MIPSILLIPESVYISQYNFFGFMLCVWFLRMLLILNKFLCNFSRKRFFVSEFCYISAMYFLVMRGRLCIYLGFKSYKDVLSIVLIWGHIRFL